MIRSARAGARRTRRLPTIVRDAHPHRQRRRLPRAPDWPRSSQACDGLRRARGRRARAERERDLELAHARTAASRSTRAANGYRYINGTPSDCVHLALSGLLEQRPDLVVSGINQGANMGDDTLYSGTVAAAMEGFLFGIPAIAFSQVQKGWDELDAAAPGRAQRHRARAARSAGGARTYLLNVNIPNRADADTLPRRITRLGRRHASEPVIRQVSPRGDTLYWIGPAGDAREAGPGHRLPRHQRTARSRSRRCTSTSPITRRLPGWRRLGQQGRLMTATSGRRASFRSRSVAAGVRWQATGERRAASPCCGRSATLAARPCRCASARPAVGPRPRLGRCPQAHGRSVFARRRHPRAARARGVRARCRAICSSTPRWRPQAYEDTSLPIGHGQTISKPSVVGAHARAAVRWRECGAARATSAPCSRSAPDAAIRRRSWPRSAQRVDLGRAAEGPARQGAGAARADARDAGSAWCSATACSAIRPGAPYDSIIAAAGGSAMPEAWLEQLAVGGRLVSPVAAVRRAGRRWWWSTGARTATTGSVHEAVQLRPLKIRAFRDEASKRIQCAVIEASASRRALRLVAFAAAALALFGCTQHAESRAGRGPRWPTPRATVAAASPAVSPAPTTSCRAGQAAGGDGNSAQARLLHRQARRHADPDRPRHRPELERPGALEQPRSTRT